jgi:hypothetical protein
MEKPPFDRPRELRADRLTDLSLNRGDSSNIARRPSGNWLPAQMEARTGRYASVGGL